MKLFVGAKAAVCFRGKVLLVRESSAYDEGTKAGKWDMVGGRIEPEETVREGLVREVKEESGREVTPMQSLDVFDGFMNIHGGECHVVRIYFLCEADSDKVTLSGDHDKYEWVDPNNWGDKILMDDINEVLEMVSKIKR